MFDALEKAYAVRDVHLIYLPVDPKWDAYRADARFRRTPRTLRLRSEVLEDGNHEGQMIETLDNAVGPMCVVSVLVRTREVRRRPDTTRKD